MTLEEVYKAIIANSKKYRENADKMIRAAESGNKYAHMMYIDIERHLNKVGVELRQKLPLKSLFKKKGKAYED